MSDSTSSNFPAMEPTITSPPHSPSRSSSESGSASFGDVAPYYDHLMMGVPYRFWLAYLDRLWDLHSLPRSRVLDLACGTGTVSRLLSARGTSVVGVDLSESMLRIARARTEEEGQRIEYICQDAAELNLPEYRFETVVSLFDSLNYILKPERLAQAFAQVYDHLDPGGSFIFDLNTEYAFEQGMFNQSCTRRDEPLHYRWRSRYNPTTRICTVNMSFSIDRGGVREQFKEVHRQRAYSKSEIISYLGRAGFEGITIYDAYSTDPPTPRSDRLFYVALKAA